jgi:hypothetical protein
MEEKTNVYTIFGHGGDGKNKFIVPDGCMIITITHKAQLIRGDQHYRCMRNIMKMPMDVLLDPLHNKNKIFKNFKAVTYYPPGKKCPNFEYQFASIFKRTKNNTNNLDYYTCLPGCGLTNVGQFQRDFMHLYDNIGKPDNKITNIPSLTFEGLQHHLKGLYNISTFPKKDVIHGILSNLHTIYEMYKSKDEATAIMNTYRHGLRIIYDSPLILRNQESLCAEFPGIYYNFSCRDVPDLTDLLYTEEGDPIARNSIPKERKSLKRKVESYDKKLLNYDRQQKKLYNELDPSFKRNYESLKKKEVSLDRKIHELKEKGKQGNNIADEYKKLTQKKFELSRKKSNMNNDLENIQAINDKKFRVHSNRTKYARNLSISRQLASVFHNRMMNVERKKQARNYYTSEEFEQDRLGSYNRKLESYNRKAITPSLTKKRRQVQKERNSFVRNYEKTKKQRL